MYYKQPARLARAFRQPPKALLFFAFASFYRRALVADFEESEPLAPGDQILVASSTWTASSTTTTPSGVPPAMRCWACSAGGWPMPWKDAAARTGWAATSSA